MGGFFMCDRSAFPDTHHLHKRMADLEKRLSQLGLIPNQETFFNRQYSKRYLETLSHRLAKPTIDSIH